MSKPLSTTELDAIERMPAEQRYDYFIRKTVELKQVWGLAGDEGWVILTEAGEEHLPVWPHREMAAAWASGEFADCQPQAIPLTDWLDKWLPGMERDELLPAVCPDKEGDCIIVAAAELLHETHAAGAQ
ncbi:hypothetical protein Tel_15045 [Candidatus Tenderia electrophaga]|jgi:hypothetical protein|uniref:DUF2750 domain-containing protein n=1 Tax=Candidatus Tenderia electrophaga TaxID=1748243 RepID=A0A0S2TGU5_9GAMM|nr:hypothetical protein Tel_15045 [Candidatus Tenderia electrophaga]